SGYDQRLGIYLRLLLHRPAQVILLFFTRTVHVLRNVRHTSASSECRRSSILPESLDVVPPDHRTSPGLYREPTCDLPHRESASGTSMVPIADSSTSCAHLSRWG